MPNLDHPSCAADRAPFERRLAEYGYERVQAMQATGAFPTTSDVVINAWLAANAPKTDPKK